MNSLPIVSLEQLATHLYTAIPTFAKAMQEHRKDDLEYARSGVYVTGHWWTRVSLAAESPYPGAVVHIASTFFNTRPSQLFTLPSTPNFIACRVEVSDTLVIASLTPQQQAFFWNGIAPPLSLMWRQDPSCQWLERGKLEVLQYIKCPNEGTTPKPSDLEATLIALCTNAKLIAETFKKLGDSQIEVVQQPLLVDSAGQSLHKLLRKRDFNIIRHDKNGEGTIDFSEDPILKNNNVLAKAALERPWLTLAATDEAFADRYKITFLSTAYVSALTTGMADLIIEKTSEHPEFIKILFDAYDYLENDTASLQAITWYQEHNGTIGNVGTEIGTSLILGQLKAIYTYDYLNAVVDTETLTKMVGNFRNASYLLQLAFLSSNSCHRL